MVTSLELQHFAVLTISYFHLASSIIIVTTTNNPCHLTCYYTDKTPVRHPLSRIVRGLALPWGAYWCFVAWQEVEQQEDGDTLTHTFEVPDWSYCQTKWLCFRGAVAGELSPSVSALLKHHHPGVFTHEVEIRIAHNNDDYRRLDGAYQACPSICPPLLEAGYFYAIVRHVGCGLRFLNVSIPPHAVILEANLTFTASQDMAGTCRYTRISAEQEDNPPDFSLDDWFSAKTRWLNSGTTFDWDDIPFWTTNNVYISPDISLAVQELIDRPLWASGNSMVLFWSDWDERSGHLPYKTRRAYSYNVSAARSVKLYVKYES